MLRFSQDEEALFIGEEQEGSDKGRRTLFVVNEVEKGLIRSVLEEQSERGTPITQLYLGAGFLSPATPEYVKYIAQFMSQVCEDKVMLTVEQPYVDLKILRECDRLDKWIYTPMMEAKLNSNYHQTMMMLTNEKLQESLQLEEHRLTKVFVKFDFAQTTVVMALGDLNYSAYHTYGGDELVYTTHPENHFEEDEDNGTDDKGKTS